LEDKDGFGMIWRYFAWLNQALSVFTLWAITAYLVRAKKMYLISLIPALFMTMVCVSYIFVAPECMGQDKNIAYIAGGIAVVTSIVFFCYWKFRVAVNMPNFGD